MFIYLAALGLSCGTKGLRQSCVVFLCSWQAWWPAALGTLVLRPEAEPLPPALQGGFLTPGQPGKSLVKHLIEGF